MPFYFYFFFYAGFSASAEKVTSNYSMAKNHNILLLGFLQAKAATTQSLGRSQPLTWASTSQNVGSRAWLYKFTTQPPLTVNAP